MGKPRECLINWNGYSRQGEWIVGCDWPKLEREHLSMPVPFIEKSAYEAVAGSNEKLVEALDKIWDLESHPNTQTAKASLIAEEALAEHAERMGKLK